MAGSPALFIDGKFVGCPRPHSKNARFHKGLEAFTRQTIASQGCDSSRFSTPKPAYYRPESSGIDLFSETGSLLTPPSTGESASAGQSGRDLRATRGV